MLFRSVLSVADNTVYLDNRAVPDPAPAPVAIKIVLGLLSAAPSVVKSVVPAETIVYSFPATKLPALIDGPTYSGSD